MAVRVDRIFEDYLARAGRLEDVELGEDETAARSRITIRQEDSDAFAARLASRQRFSNAMVAVCLVMLCAVFAIGAAGAVLVLRSPGISAAVLAATLAALLGVVAWLRRIWIEKSVLDLAAGVVRDLPPEEAVRLIEVIYWNALRRRPRAAAE